MNKNNLRRFTFLAPVLVSILVIAGCRETGERFIEAQMASQFITQRNSDACFTSLDRLPIPSLESLFAPPEGMVMAGFITTWAPGADPIPCNRFKRAEVQGMFKFNSRGLSDPPTRMALLELVEFQPLAGSVRVGSRTTCNFKVLSKRYPNALDGRFHHGLDIMSGATELASRPRSIVVPGGAGRWNAVVTDEVLQTSRSPADVYAPTVFLVVQNDAAFDGNQTSACAGNFRFRLRLFTDG